MMKTALRITLVTSFILTTLFAHSQDPNFYIFLCFGQSNMEGQGTIQSQDKTVDERFRVLQAVDCSNLNRTKGTWYTAVPPLTRCWTRLSPADYFGRTLVENLPSGIRIGVINVSVGGCRIELFDKDIYENYKDTHSGDWFANIIAEYDGNPYAYLVDLAKDAKQDGVIKGILLHQGESNNGDNQWPAKVKKIYDDLMTDLSLNPEEVPLLAGEVVHEDQDGLTAGMNAIINKLPETLPNSYVISSSGCTDVSDNLHFDAAGYRELGRRYGEKMLSLLGDVTAAPLSIQESRFSLDQNHPNPVHGSSRISFEIPKSTNVTITIHDLLGNTVADIVNKPFATGRHTVQYDFQHLTEGIYFYTMKTDDFQMTRKIILR